VPSTPSREYRPAQQQARILARTWYNPRCRPLYGQTLYRLGLALVRAPRIASEEGTVIANVAFFTL
jgi:hypothetical protein